MASDSVARQARPEAVLIVLFLIIALYVFFGRVGRSRGKGSDGAESENLRSRNLEEGLESEKKRIKHSSSGRDGQAPKHQALPIQILLFQI